MDFNGTTIFCGIDVHKKNWRINIQDREFELEDFSQDPDVVLLQLLHFSGVSLPQGYEAGQYWSKNFIKQLESLDCRSEMLKTTLRLYIQDYQQTKALLLEATRNIRQLCNPALYEKDISLLKSIPGVGGINAAIILFELQDVTRFKHFDHLSS